MTSQVKMLDPKTVADRLAAGQAVLIDIREPDEFARSHIRGALSYPLSGWEAAHLTLRPDEIGRAHV